MIKEIELICECFNFPWLDVVGGLAEDVTIHEGDSETGKMKSRLVPYPYINKQAGAICQTSHLLPDPCKKSVLFFMATSDTAIISEGKAKISAVDVKLMLWLNGKELGYKEIGLIGTQIALDLATDFKAKGGNITLDIKSIDAKQKTINLFSKYLAPNSENILINPYDVASLNYRLEYVGGCKPLILKEPIKC